LQLDIGIAHAVHVNPLAVIVNGNRQFLLGGFLTDHVLIEKLLDLQRLRNLIGSSGRRLDFIIFQNRVANSYALVTDVCPRVVARRRNELAYYILTFMAKRTP
jgi:hypothetical protein